MKFNLSKILWKINNINLIFDELMIVFYLIMRLLVVAMITIVLIGNGIIRNNWLIDFCFSAYIIYPIYRHFFYEFFYRTIKRL